MKPFLRCLSWFFSIVFHPLGIILIGCLLNELYYCITISETTTSDYFSQCELPFATIFLYLYVIPLILCGIVEIIFIRPHNVSHNIERFVLCLIIAIVNFLYVVLQQNEYFSTHYQSFIIASAIITIIAGAINLFWKISLHTIGIGGLMGFLISINYSLSIDFVLLLSITTLLAVIIAFSRYYLKAHTLWQLVSGFLLGEILILSIMGII